jgi:hypothetical protein
VKDVGGRGRGKSFRRGSGGGGLDRGSVGSKAGRGGYGTSGGVPAISVSAPGSYLAQVMKHFCFQFLSKYLCINLLITPFFTYSVLFSCVLEYGCQHCTGSGSMGTYIFFLVIYVL